MGISEAIMERLKEAMKAKDEVALAALRALKNAILVEERKGEIHTISEDDKTAIVRGQIKQRKESAETYAQSGRKDLADRELQEISILENFLPKALSAEELAAIVKQAVAESGATSVKDLGKAMKLAREKAGSRADGKALSDAVKAALS